MAIREWVRMQEPRFYRYAIFKRVPTRNEGISAPCDYSQNVITLHRNKRATYNAAPTTLFVFTTYETSH
jgi:hypothetical protein